MEMFNKTYMFIWGMVMYLFELDASILNKSLTNSMIFLYKDSDPPLNSIRELIPFDLLF